MGTHKGATANQSPAELTRKLSVSMPGEILFLLNEMKSLKNSSTLLSVSVLSSDQKDPVMVDVVLTLGEQGKLSVLFLQLHYL